MTSLSTEKYKLFGKLRFMKLYGNHHKQQAKGGQGYKPSAVNKDTENSWQAFVGSFQSTQAVTQITNT